MLSYMNLVSDFLENVLGDEGRKRLGLCCLGSTNWLFLAFFRGAILASRS